MSQAAAKVEFGDFQTPRNLARKVCELLASSRTEPATIIEPTCGVGVFFSEALRAFPCTEQAFAYDINPAYAEECKSQLPKEDVQRCQVGVADFFAMDWCQLLDASPEPMLVIGNPPWVTNSTLGGLGSENLPKKFNFKAQKGLDALTGKSNFDISEWMLLRLLDWLSGRHATMAMLCKTAVARKALMHAWQGGLEIAQASLHRIDAAGEFGVSVDACLITFTMQPGQYSLNCQVYEELSSSSPLSVFGYHDSRLVADVDTYERLHSLAGKSSYRWRSGVKHDCSKVMELRETEAGKVNGYGELVDIEKEFCYPLAKSSDVAKGATAASRHMIVTQKEVGEETIALKEVAPSLWAYLNRHADKLDRRGSSIYKKRPRFSIFGVGGYTFAPWKVAISGFYKSLSFTTYGPQSSKPFVFDDTVYAIGCQSKQEAELLQQLLSSDEAQDFYSSLIFWDAKRPITVDLLGSLSLDKLSRRLGLSEEFYKFRDANPWAEPAISPQPSLFPA